jgi:hypothetical protein
MIRIPELLDRASLELEFEDAFDQPRLDLRRWIPEYLPQWSTPERTAARYEILDGRLRLLIEADQPPWCPELDGGLRVSSIQTGVCSGPIGSDIGQHRFKPNAVVRTQQVGRWLYTPTFGLIELRARVPRDPGVMAALWMIGIEDAPEHSAEICVAEIFGREMGPDRARVGQGLRPFGDPSIAENFEALELPIDASTFHVYSAAWTPGRVAWYVDDRLTRVAHQAPVYPMQLMLSFYEFPAESADERLGGYPKAFDVDWVRGYRL